MDVAAVSASALRSRGGFGAGGIAAAPLGKPWRLGIPLVALTVFETLCVGPLWRFLYRFESREAVTLESSMVDDAHAVTGFEVNGNGLVSLEVDGKVAQLLATLASSERARGIGIHSGDRARIAEVDADRGRRTVTSPTR